MDYTEIEDVFVKIGGEFYASAYNIQAKLKDIKAYVFDWDGVFNDARREVNLSGSYSMIDTLGIRMLRFAHFLMHKNIARVAVFDEQNNSLAKLWGKAESVDEVYVSIRNKEEALEHFCTKHGIEPANVVYVFDDILDVSTAKKAGIRMAVGRKESPGLREYLKNQKLVDYISGNDGRNHAVREHCELLLMLFNKHHEVIDRMAKYDPACKDFDDRSKQTATEIYSYSEERFQLTT